MDYLQQQLDEEQKKKQKELWKLFGRETAAGKALFSLYKSHEAPKINYPKPKPKSKQQLQRQSMKETKKCPQTTQIEYPELPQKSYPKIHMVDLIPRRKNEAVIKEEMDKFYSKVEVPANRGIDRAKEVEKLQKNFKNQRGALPKGAEMPAVKLDADELNDEQIKKRAAMRVEKKYKLLLEGPKQPGKEAKSEKEELNEMFDDIVREIEERQQYLDSIDHLDEPAMKARIKRQMIERVSQLQKITELRNKSKA